MRHFIQIAGVKNIEEAQIIAESGATHLGFPMGLDYHAEDTSVEEASSIIRKLPGNVFPVLITYYNKAGQIRAMMDNLGCRIVQLHGKVSISEIKKLRMVMPGIEIWKSLVIHPQYPDRSFAELKEFVGHVDTFITDTFDPDTGASGATGKTHDWNISREIIRKSQKPVIIAGGLNPGNVGDAVRATRPAGVDVHTGVENRAGLKDQRLVSDFVYNARKAFTEIDQEP